MRQGRPRASTLLAAPDAAAGAAGFVLGAAQALGGVGAGAGSAVEHDCLAEVIVADRAAELPCAAIDRFAGDFAAGDVAAKLVRPIAGLAGEAAQMNQRTVDPQR